MREKILNDLMLSMKNKEKDKLSVLRMVKGAIQLEEIEKTKQLDDKEVILVISKQIQTEKEIEILQEYMPEQLSEEEVNNIIDLAIKEVNPSSNSDMGKIMKVVTPKLAGQADMSSVSKIVKEKLTNIVNK